jgi:hypothetical protein
MQCLDDTMTKRMRQWRQALLHQRDRELRIVLAQVGKAATGFGLVAAENVGGA